MRLLTSSGLRCGEGGSLLTFKVPHRQLKAGRYYRGKAAAAVTRSKRSRTFYVAAEAVGDIEVYADSSRTLAIAEAQRRGRYEGLAGMRLVAEVTRGVRPAVRWSEPDGTSGVRALDLLTVAERMRLFTEGEDGLEPLWLWLGESGIPMAYESWEKVFDAANARVAAVLTSGDLNASRDRNGEAKRTRMAISPHMLRHVLSA